MRWMLVIAAVLVGCGSSGSASSAFANKCAAPRTGVDAITGRSFPDRQGTVTDEKRFLKAWTNELYLWYREVPDSDPASSQYATPLDYFAVLKTSATTASKAPKDKFHFTYPTDFWESLSQTGVSAGYGAEWFGISRKPPREYVVAYTEPNSPASANNLARGAHVVSCDGTALLDGDASALNACMYPTNTGEAHTFEILDPGQSQSRTFSMTSAAVTEKPVDDVGTAAGGTVGYILFKDHIATAESQLVAAINQLKGVQDLVLDLRYNGGGYLDIASEMAYMIAGPGPTNGKTFEKIKFNDKYPTNDPITGATLSPTGFHSVTQGFSTASGAALPHLDLPRVFVLTSASTCSASESIINSLSGVDVQVIEIGLTTCGKPYGFYPQDNCGTTYFSIEFQGVNAKGFGDYSDGFVPASTLPSGLPGCAVNDDFTHALGDPAEARFAAALQYRGNQTCPPAPTSIARGTPLYGEPAAGDGVVSKGPWRENRILIQR